MEQNKSTEKENVDVALSEKLIWSLKEAVLCTGLSEYAIRQLVKQEDCPFVLYIGRKIFIKRREMERFLSEVQNIDI